MIESPGQASWKTAQGNERDERNDTLQAQIGTSANLTKQSALRSILDEFAEPVNEQMQSLEGFFGQVLRGGEMQME